ncbi:MAG: glycosyltransferase [Bryobacterales bacterium]|nr:glycosyltransferase [Bryobacterales bacterium]
MAHPGWLEALVKAAQAYPEYGMFSCQIRLAGTPLLDSTALLLSRDGSSIQRGHGQPWATHESAPSALLPSGCAALYRRKAMQEAGHFDVDFFLYGEDTDLGLRMQWMRWPCRYVSDAIVEHAYSASAGVASPLKAYLVERNRLYLVIRNLPLTDAVAALASAPLRYLLHLVSMVRGRGKAAEFARTSSGWQLPWMVLKAHVVTLFALPRLVRQRHAIRRHARVSKAAFRKAIYAHRVSLWKVAQH